MENKNLPINYIGMIEEISEKDKFSEKVKVLSRALDRESEYKKSMKEQMQKNGLRFSGKDYDYIPIEVIEESLRQIFLRQIDFIIKQSYRDLNSFVVIARLRYVDPATGLTRIIDGIGAASLQQDSGAQISDFNSTMKKNAMELGVGIAYSRAIKNAAKKLGKLFGANLNRDEEIENVTVFKKAPKDEQLEEVKKLFMEKIADLKEPAINRIREIIRNKEESSYSKVIKDLEDMN